MTKIDELLDAIHRLDALREKGQDLAEEARAWRLLRGTLQLPARRPPSPPTELGEAASEARALADLLDKTGQSLSWRTPPAHSQAMERLIHRLTVLLERFLDLYGAGQRRCGFDLAAEDADVGVMFRWQADDHYQTSYCDDCGAELHPSGVCPLCGAKDDPSS